MNVLLQPNFRVTFKSASFKWVSEQEKALERVQAAVQVFLPWGPYDPADPKVTEVSTAKKDTVVRFQKAPQENHEADL